MWRNNQLDEQKVAGVSQHTGFPNPAIDSSLQGLDLNKYLVHNRASSFAMRVAGDQWATQGVYHNDIVLVDRALNANKNDMVIWHLHDSFVMSYLHKVPSEAVVWGTVTATIHQVKKIVYGKK